LLLTAPSPPVEVPEDGGETGEADARAALVGLIPALLEIICINLILCLKLSDGKTLNSVVNN
jgi:hypothetical protein